MGSISRVFRFEKGRTGIVEYGNKDTDGHVIIDVVQRMPVDMVLDPDVRAK